MIVLTKQEAREAVEKTNKEPGFMNSDMPIFAKGRIDVCAAVKHEEKGTDRVYLIWKNRSGVRQKEVARHQGGFLEIKEVFKSRRNIVVRVDRDGLFFGSFWIPLIDLDLEDSFN